MSQELKQAVQNALDANGQLPCTTAFRIATETGATPAEIGHITNELDIRLTRCQLGLFGYGSKAEGTHRIVEPMERVPAPLEQAIRKVWAGAGITCAQAWEISRATGYSKRDVADACEALNAHITTCQLGAFPRPKR